MFDYISSSHPMARSVRGGSWLYNLVSYRRLFPPTYISTANEGYCETDSIALWGQFLTAKGLLREPEATNFKECAQRQNNIDGALHCFPLKVLRPSCPITEFLRFYHIS